MDNIFPKLKLIVFNFLNQREHGKKMCSSANQAKPTLFFRENKRYKDAKGTKR